MDQASYFRRFECDLDDPNVGPQWTEWLEDLEQFLTFVNVTADERKKAALLHHAGVSIAKIYRTVEFKALPYQTPVEEDSNVRPVDQYVDVKRKLSSYFNPKQNI